MGKILTEEMKLIPNVLAPAVSLPLRDGFGKAIVELGEQDKDVWALSADVSESSRTHWFQEKFPSRFVQVGVAEQNMASVAAGIASCGKKVFFSAYPVFSPGRNWDQIRVSICYNNPGLVVIHGSHAGLTVGEDGASHQALEDISMVRALPNLIIEAPADFEQVKKATKALYANGTPAYLRTSRQKAAVFTTPDTPFEIGKANVYRDGSDLAIFACGFMVYECLKAAEAVKNEIDCAVIDCHTIKPIDRETIVRWAKKCGMVLTVEEHQVDGGMGSAVCEVLAEEYPCKVKRHGVYNRFCESGTANELLKKYKLDANGIAEQIKEAMKMKK